MTGPFFAHSTTGSKDGWERLEDHLANVARKASEFTAAFDSESWGRLAGLWHDIGKYRSDFQRRIQGEQIQAPHAGAGAALAYPFAPPLAFAIGGHHSGLANRAARGESSQMPLQQLVADNAGVLAEISRIAPKEMLEQPRLEVPPWLKVNDPDERKLRMELWTRFLFSALVDADRLATEAFYAPAKRDELAYDSINTLCGRIDARLDAFERNTQVNMLRGEVLDCCRRAAGASPGLFSLSVPTGGGKTLAGMSFALRHAERNGLRRVIVVAPYTSIIEQNAEVYCDVLGAQNVIEHHSAIDEEARDRVAHEPEVRRRLAIENWDAPVIVTTAVQFFETLFTNDPSRCRKLHNIARSVIVVDEAQTLPPELLLTILDAMRQLTTNYGCSIVLSTATQPALAKRDALPSGLSDVREIVDDPAQLASSLRRVTVRWPSGGATTPYADIAGEMVHRRQVMTIVHSRADARRLSEMLPRAGMYHLSTRMCAGHRLETFHALKASLASGAVCRVVSTQLVEAGVDLSFPVVYRGMAGLDSLIQAAGRCNRNGELQDAEGRPMLGEFVVFHAESQPPRGVLQRGLEVAEGMLRVRRDIDLGDPATLDEYFRALYFGSELDPRGVMGERRNFNFATVAQKVHLISDGTRPVVVPWGDAASRIARFEKSLKGKLGGSRLAARALQPFVVQVHDHELQLLERQGAIAVLDGFGHMLVEPFLHLYDKESFGLTLDEDAAADAAALVI